MTRAKGYDSITHYLKNNNGSQVTLSFTQFDELLFPRSGLPHTARQDRQIGGRMIIVIRKKVHMVG